MRSIARGIILTIIYLLLCGSASAAQIRSTLVDAQKQFQQKHYEQALKLYKQADEAEPGHSAIQYNMALCHLNLGDGGKAMQHFEKVASQMDISQSLRRDAFYNVGFIRTEAARRQLKELLAPATQPAERIEPDAPANIEKLQAIADQLLRAIFAFKESNKIEPNRESEHNIRAARITRRNVLGLLKKAVEKKEKEDILKDPRAFLEELIFEQDRQTGLTRYLILNPPEEPKLVRAARRASVRLQRKIMERTDTFANHLAQFREAAQQQEPQKPPTTQPAEETPREKIYHAAAKQIESAIEAQRDACAHLLDNEIKPACDKQFDALNQMS
ncbi:MAG: tetratricopeptide repeat protein, partial [Planctomycetota bacterium]